MKRPHRRAHLLIWLILTPLLAVALIASLSSRREPPVVEDPLHIGAAEGEG